MDSRNTQNGNGGIQLTVTPKSSAFFSGETLHFAITFRNTRPRQQQHVPQYSNAPPTPHSAQSSNASTSRRPSSHGKHLSTSALQYQSHSSGASSAPPSRSAFPQALHHQHAISGSASPSRSYTDLSIFASPDNRSGSSSHIVLPERKGIIGTPLGLASSSTTTSTPVTSPTQHLRRPYSFNQVTPPPPQSAPTRDASSLYPNKRLPGARHRKNDYSVAGLSDDPTATSAGNCPPSNSIPNDDLIGVSDLSSQLAGMAILQQREGSLNDDGDEDAVMNAQPFVEQYKRQADALQNRYPSIVTNGSWRSAFTFPLISFFINTSKG